MLILIHKGACFGILGFLLLQVKQIGTHCMYLKNSTGVRTEFFTNVQQIKVPRNCQHKFTQLFEHSLLLLAQNYGCIVLLPVLDVTNTASNGVRASIFQVTASRVL
jgi:hypothetical protein